MDKIVFLNNEEIKYNGIITKKSNGLINIIFDNIIPDDETLTSGFYIENNFNGKNMTGDSYYQYNTIYRKFDNELKIMLSNDGSIYVEPDEKPNTNTESKSLLLRRIENIEESLSTIHDDIWNDIAIAIQEGVDEV